MKLRTTIKIVFAVGLLAATPISARQASGARVPIRAGLSSSEHALDLCRSSMQTAAQFLAAEASRDFGLCAQRGVGCLLGGSPDICCAREADLCRRDLERLDYIGSLFRARLEEGSCELVTLDSILADTGLGLGSIDEACGRLHPAGELDDRAELADCLERLIVEDVWNRLLVAEQPRAEEGFACLDLEDELPAARSLDPATCEPQTTGPTPTPVQATPTPAAPTPGPTGGGQTPTPGPTARPTATPVPTSQPTPGPTGGATPSPSPAPTASPSPGATPTPTPPPQGGSCSQATLTISSDYEPQEGDPITGVTVTVDYPGTKVQIAPSQLASRVTNLTGASGIFQSADNDVVVPGDGFNDRLSVGLVSIPGPIPPGSFAKVVFDCEGDTAPTLNEFSCTIDVSSFLGLEVEADCDLSLSTTP